MLKFLEITDYVDNKGVRVLDADFVLRKIPVDGLMTRGGHLYAVLDTDTNMWLTGNEAYQYVITETDAALREYAEQFKAQHERVKIPWMWNPRTQTAQKFRQFVLQYVPQNTFIALDQKLTFADTKVKASDYASIRLPYSLEDTPTPAYDEITSTLYEPEELKKIEWAIGSIVSGDSKRIQKFIVLYGEGGTGKGTILNIICALFSCGGKVDENGQPEKRYYTTFNAKALTSKSDSFSTETFKDGPLVAVQMDGDLSKIEDNTILNTLVAHEEIECNPKFQSKFPMRCNAFLFLGSNSPVKITDAKSGLIRRLIDVNPKGKEKVPPARYRMLMKQIKNHELGGIAYHCLKVYESMGEDYYNGYVPIAMIAATNDFYNFIDHIYDQLDRDDSITLSAAWELYGQYCTYANSYKIMQKQFRSELMNYFDRFDERPMIEGKRVRSLYSGFKRDKFLTKPTPKEDFVIPDWLKLEDTASVFDEVFADSLAQLEVDYGKGGQPGTAWARCKTKLKDIDTHKTHYMKPPVDVNLVMIDFDKKGKDGKKSYVENAKAAASWVPTYAELSKSGGGIHCYYIYDGDIEELSTVFDDDIEIKLPIGGSAFRRALTKCNTLPIAHLSAGSLPKQKRRKKVIDVQAFVSERGLRALIKRNMAQEIHGNHPQSIHFIDHLLNQAYESGKPYDVSDMYPAILKFAQQAHDQRDHCVSVVAGMKFKSEVEPPAAPDDEGERQKIVLDTEIYRPDTASDNPGLFLIVFKLLNVPDSFVIMKNPKATDVEELLRLYDIITFNGREYDNPMLLAAATGETNAQLYDRSYRLINLRDKNANSTQARNASWCDVYEYCKAAGEGMSLKKWEIKLGHSHKEMGISWEEPAPLDMWDEIVEYCKNDVLATEAVYNATQPYLMARKFQVDLVKLLHPECTDVRINDTANSLTKKIIFGLNRTPQGEFNYRDLSQPVGSNRYEEYRRKFGDDYVFRVWNAEGLPEYRDYISGEELPEGWSILPFFPGYTFDRYAPKDKKSLFHGIYGGEGGRVFSEPGMYINVWDGDIASQYPHSIMAEVLFGPKYTKVFSEIVAARVAVKHRDFAAAEKLLDGALKPYLNDESAKDLAQAMKIIINSVYGLTSASFENEFRDPRNVDNIVAKRGNLFMLVLKEQIEKRGYKVCHIKTDSIKIPNATQEIKDFVVRFGKEYGYTFETEGDFAKFVLMNDASYVAYDRKEGWLTKAAQFQEPYVKKTLITKEPVVFDDLCQTFNVMKGAIYLDENEGLPDIEHEVHELTKQYTKELRYSEKLIRKKLPGTTDNWIASLQDGDERARKYFADCYDDVAVCEVRQYLEPMWALADKIRELEKTTDSSHKYVFVGRVGRFCPVVDGAGGGILYRVQDDKYYAVSGTKGYRWLESEDIKNKGKEACINREYFDALVDDAAKAIAEYGDLEWFLSDSLPDPELPEFMNVPENGPEEVPL